MTRQLIAHTDLYNDLCVFINARGRTRNARTRTRKQPLANVADVKHIRFASRSTIKEEFSTARKRKIIIFNRQ